MAWLDELHHLRADPARTAFLIKSTKDQTRRFSNLTLFCSITSHGVKLFSLLLEVLALLSSHQGRSCRTVKY